MPLRPPVAVPTELREFTRWCEEQSIIADNNSVGEDELQANSVSTTKIQDGTVTLAKLADMTADRILGRLSTNGVPVELTAAQVVGLLQAVAWAFTDDIGFHGATATAQQTSPSSVNPTSVSGSGDDATINANFTAVANAVNIIKTALDNKGLTG